MQYTFRCGTSELEGMAEDILVEPYDFTNEETEGEAEPSAIDGWGSAFQVSALPPPPSISTGVRYLCVDLNDKDLAECLLRKSCSPGFQSQPCTNQLCSLGDII